MEYYWYFMSKHVTLIKLQLLYLYSIQYIPWVPEDTFF